MKSGHVPDRKKRLERDISRILFPPSGGGGYLSGPAIARGDERPTRPGTGHPIGGLFSLAPDGVYPAPDVTVRAVSSYLAFSPLPSRAVCFLWHFPPVARSRR